MGGRRKGEEELAKRGREEEVTEGIGRVEGREEGGGRTVKVAPEGRIKCWADEEERRGSLVLRRGAAVVVVVVAVGRREVDEKRRLSDISER